MDRRHEEKYIFSYFKFLEEDIRMKSIKTNFIIILSILTVSFISCKSPEKPKTFKVSDTIGTWTCNFDGSDYSFTVKDDGVIIGKFQVPFNNSNISIDADITNKSWDADKNKEVEEYKSTASGKGKANIGSFPITGDITCQFKFKSANSCTMSGTVTVSMPFGGQQQSQSIPPLIFKK